MRGDNELVTMKGFLADFMMKGDGHTEETLPADPDADVTDKAEVDAVTEGKKGANVKGGENKKSDTATTTMSDEVSEVEEGAERDIADGYVQDVKKDKGWEQYNSICDTGVVVKNFGLTKHNVGEAISRMEDEIETKSRMLDFGNKIVEGVRDVGRKVGLDVRKSGKKSDIARWKAERDAAPDANIMGAAPTPKPAPSYRTRAGAAMTRHAGKTGAAVLGAGTLAAGGVGYGGYRGGKALMGKKDDAETKGCGSGKMKIVEKEE